MLSSSKKHIISYDECNKIYMRDFIGNYIVTKYNNQNTSSSGNLLSNIDLSYSVDNGQIVYESNASKQHFLNH